MASSFWETFPLPAEKVNDVKMEWPIAGKFACLPEIEFENAFSNLDIPKNWKPVTRASFNKLAGWKQQQLIEKLKEPPPYTYSFCHAEVDGAADIENIDWKSCVGVERSDSGSEGVIFVELPGKRAVVVKSPVYVASEVFGNILCRRLGINCPKSRIVCADSSEGKVLMDSLISADSWRDVEERKVQSMIAGRPWLLVIEYIKAKELANLFPPTSKEWSEQSFGLPERGSLSDQGREILRALGTLIAFDLIINNFDRLPCIWDNAGNPGNLMFLGNSAEPISIDNMVCCIPPENAEATSKYLEAVKWLVLDVARGPDVECMEFSRVRSFLKEGCLEGHGWPGLQIDIGAEGTLEIQTGFLNLVHFAAYGDGGDDGGGITLEWLEEVRDALLQLLPGVNPLSNAPMHLYGFGTIHPKFCFGVIETFRSALAEVGLASGTRGQKPALLSTGSKLLRSRRDRAEASLYDGSLQLPMFVNSDCIKTHLDYYNQRQAKLSRDAAINVLRLQAVRAREAKSKKMLLEPTPDGFYRIEALACLPPWPKGVQADRREAWLSPEDFQTVFGIDKVTFSALPLWSQQFRKKKANLF